MPNTALSNEIVGLFDRVRQQADSYSAAFEMLTRKGQDIDRQRQGIHQTLMSFKSEGEQHIASFDSAAATTITEFKLRIAKVEELHTGLAQIHQLRDSLIELQSRLESRSVELDTIISTIKHNVKKETKAEFMQQERKIASKLQALENEVTSFDSRLYTIQEFQKREVLNLGDEIDRFKNKIAETKYIVDETTKIVTNTVENAEINFTASLQKFNDEINQRVKSTLETLMGDDQVAQKLNKLQNENSYSMKRIGQLESRLNMVLWISVGTGAVAILLSIITLLK